MEQTNNLDTNAWEEWKQKDRLNRTIDVQGFGNILLADKGHDVFSISAKFGFGKTFFCDGLKAYLECNGTKCIFYNAWKSDFFDNPLIPIISAIEEKFKQYPNKITKLKQSGERLLKSLSLSALGIEITPSEVFTENTIFEKYDSYLKAITDIKSSLDEVVRNEEKALVIIVDELDRCRPDYAVKTLETIKHFFDIDGVKFVISIDEDQIKSSVKQLYGTENFDGYIRKFINYRFRLPEAKKAEYIDFLIENLGINAKLEKIVYKEMIGDTLKAWSYFFDFSFRTIYQIIKRIDLRLKSNVIKNEHFYGLIATIACLIEFNNDFFETIKNKETYDFNDLESLHLSLVSKGYILTKYNALCKRFYGHTFHSMSYSEKPEAPMSNYTKKDYFEDFFLPEAEKMEFLKLLDIPDAE